MTPTALFSRSAAIWLCACLSLACGGEVSGGGPRDDGGSGGGAGGGSGGGSGGSGSGGNAGGGAGGSAGSGGSGGSGGGPAGDWGVSDQISGKKTLSLNNGDFDFVFEEAKKSAAPFGTDQTLLIAKMSARGGASYSITTTFNMFVGINTTGPSEVFYSFAGPMTGHKVEDLGSDGKRVTFEYDKPYDGFKMDRPSIILGPAKLVFTIRWKNPRVDIDQLRSMKVEFGVHNGFRSHVMDFGYPFTVHMGVDSTESRWSMNVSRAPGGEDVIGYFVREDGKLGTYAGGAASGSVNWLDYYAVEKGDRATLVYQPDFRKLALKKTYAGGFYANLFRPSTFSAGFQPTFAQTGYGGVVNYVQIAPGSYDERIRILLNQPKASAPAAYKDLVGRLM